MLLALAALLATLAYAQPADWPQFRGPAGAGLSSDSNLPAEISAQKNVAWKTALPPGHSSPILVGSRIFLTAIENETLLTLCLDRATGKILWRREAPRPRKEGFQKTNSPAAPTPTSDGESVFVFFGDFGLLAYGVDGEDRWRLPLGPFNNPNGHGSSPMIAGDLVVLICDQDTNSYVIAVDKKTGKPRWKADRAGILRGYATPAVFQPPNAPAQLIVPGSFELIAYDLKTGEKLWWVNGMAWQVKGVPLIDGDTIFFNAWENGGDFETPPNVDPWETIAAKYDINKDGRLTPEELRPIFRGGFRDYDLNRDGVMDHDEWDAYIRHRTATNNIVAIKPVGRGDLTNQVLWRYRKALPNTASPLLYQATLFLVKDGGIVTTLDAKTGAVHKQARIPGSAEQFWASPVGADGKVYMLSQSCKLAVLSAKPQWEVLRVNDLDDECFATPALADRSIYLRTKHWLYRFAQK